MSGPHLVEDLQEEPDLPGFELIPLSQNHLVVDSVALEVRGEPPTFAQWSGAAERLRKIHGAIKFYLGDICVMGESLFSEEASQVIDQSFLSEREVKDYTFVAKAVKPTIRSVAQSWDHCHVIARAGIVAPEKQREWLERSRGEDWTARKLATEIAQATADGKTVLRWTLVADCGTEAKMEKLAAYVEAEGLTVLKKQGVQRKVKKPKKARKKGPVTAQRKHKGAPKMNTRRRPPK